MEFKNTGTITKIIYDLNAEKYTNKITIKLDNHNDEEKLNVIFLNDSLPNFNDDYFIGSQIVYARYDLEYEIGRLKLDLYKRYEFEFKTITNKYVNQNVSQESQDKLQESQDKLQESQGKSQKSSEKLIITKILECNHD